jgi:Zn finger protein HypA/HybF involved in hydrogenase expression
MHESVIVYRILGEVKPQLPSGMTLKTVRVEVGEFSCVNPKALTQLFDIAKKNTFAASSRLKCRVCRGAEDIIIKSIEVAQ